MKMPVFTILARNRSKIVSCFKNLNLSFEKHFYCSAFQRREQYFSNQDEARVVVTGLGIVSPLGVGINFVWPKLLKGECGISTVPKEQYQGIPCQIAAFVPKGINPGELNFDNFSKSEIRSMSLASLYGLVAAEEAISDANWYPRNEIDRLSTGVAVGMGVVELENIVDTGCNLREKGYNKVNPHFVTRTLANMPAGYISMKYGFQGPNHSVSTACTTGAHAIGDAFNFIKKGDASVMICGSTEAVIGPLSLAAFCRIRALSTRYNNEPLMASRPFDKKRDGFVMGEGAGIVILENLQHAICRGAKIYAEILGYGLSGDAHHVTAPKKSGEGAYHCMKAALRDANLETESVQYINAHATSTSLGDEAEITAIKNVFVDHAFNLAISSTKGSIGHLLGAAGSVETIFTILACYHGSLPPTINVDEPDFSDLNLIPFVSQPWPNVRKFKRRIALTNSFGFGGTNASLIVGNME